MRETIAILDSDSLFARRLANYIKNVSGPGYDIRVYSSPEIFVSANSNSSVETLIADKENFLKICSLCKDNILNINKVRILTDDADIESCDKGNQRNIYKYQSAKKICDSIFSEETIYREEKKNEPNRSILSPSINCSEKPINEEESNEEKRRLKLIVKNKVQEKLIELGELGDDETLKIIDECLAEEKISDEIKYELRNSIYYAVRGLDVLEEFISDETITEIMVNGENKIFYERNGALIYSGKSFDSREQLRDIIQKIVSSTNRVVNTSSPIVDGRLEDGSRISVVLDPVSLDGPILTIRRFPEDPLTAEKLIAYETVSEEIINLLRKLVYAGYNILVSGSTGSGKTTILNILSGFISKDERIITIEDSAELKIMGIENLVRLESRNAGADGLLEITIRDLIKAALRMRPDRIIVGEVRGAEAIDMIQAFTVGQEGSMSTIHANSASDALYRLELLMMLGGLDIPLNAIRRQIYIGVDIVIHLGRLKDKQRKLLEVCEVTDYIDGEIKTSTLFKYEDGNFVKCGELSRDYKLKKACCI